MIRQPIIELMAIARFRCSAVFVPQLLNATADVQGPLEKARPRSVTAEGGFSSMMWTIHRVILTSPPCCICHPWLFAPVQFLPVTPTALAWAA